MRTLIFDTALSGHHLEYIHHYYMEALASDGFFIFAIPEQFNSLKDKYDWPVSDRISFNFIPQNEVNNVRQGNIYRQGVKNCLLLRRYVKNTKCDNVILTMLMQFIPFICFLLPSHVRVRGIMYKIYLYDQHHMSKVRAFAERIRFQILSKSKIISKVFVLNDQESAKVFNKKFHTDKFKFLPDPTPQPDFSVVRNIRRDLNLSKNDKLFIHFGGLDARKGSLDILKAIASSKPGELDGCSFIFAGKQNDKFAIEFNKILTLAQKRATILVFNEYCDYEFLYNLCYSCDAILMPYYITNLSSGLLGYSATFKRPVIGPKSGLIGKIIKDYHLGITIDIPFTDLSVLKSDLAICGRYEDYCKANKADIFRKSIFA